MRARGPGPLFRRCRFRAFPYKMNNMRLMNYTMRRIFAILVLASGGCFSPALAGPQEDSEKYQQALIAQGVDPSPEGLRQFFRDITATSFDDQLIDRLIAQLNSDDYMERIEAQRKLICQARLPIDKLERASLNGSPEKAYRARIVLQTWVPARRQLIESALALVAKQQIAGLAEEILATARLVPDLSTLQRPFEAALRATVTAADTLRLQATLEDENPLVTRLAMTGLVELADESWGDRLLAWADRADLDPFARILAATRALDLSDRRAFQPLIDLIRSDNSLAAVQAHVILKKVTGQRIPLVVSDPETRSQCVEQWNVWLANEGAVCPLNIPVALAKLGRSSLNGNTLIATGYRNEVIELDPDGNEVWKYTAQGAWSAEKMASGNYLIASYQQNKVLIVSPEKHVVWEYDLPGVLNARPLENGNVLASSHSENRVLEIDEDKNVVWKYSANSQCHDAMRLENGNTLICTNEDVIEVNPQGEVAWRYPAPQAYGIDVLENGNILVAHLNGSVSEVTRDQTVVWTYRFPSPVDVFRTETGTTIITGSQSSIEIDAEKNPVWTRENMQFGSVRR